MKEPMRTPTKKREVVSGAFQSSSHTRFHCKRKFCAQTQPQCCAEPHPAQGLLLGDTHISMQRNSVFHTSTHHRHCFLGQGHCWNILLKAQEKEGKIIFSPGNSMRPKPQQLSDTAPLPLASHAKPDGSPCVQLRGCPGPASSTILPSCAHQTPGAGSPWSKMLPPVKQSNGEG